MHIGDEASPIPEGNGEEEHCSTGGRVCSQNAAPGLANAFVQDEEMLQEKKTPWKWLMKNVFELMFTKKKRWWGVMKKGVSYGKRGTVSISAHT